VIGFAQSAAKHEPMALKVELEAAANLLCASAHDEPIEIGASP